MNAKVQHSVRVAIVLGALPLCMPAQVMASEDDEMILLEEIVVTAQKREESLRDVPLSVEAVSGDKLADAGIVRLDDLKAYVPNLQMSETGIANNIYIRGIGSGLNQGFEQSVSLYQDGVYRGRGHQARMPFLDLARVEVLRGPQPILFGKNAVAGAVNMVANTPGDEFEGSVRVARDIENDETTADLTLSGPFTESFGGRLAVFHRKADGYLDNATFGTHEPRRDDLGGRLTLQMDVSDALTATLRAEAGRFDTDGRHIEIFGETPISAGLPFAGATYSQALAGVMGALSLTPPPGLNEAGGNTVNYTRGASSESFSYIDSREVALTFDYQLGSGATFTSVSAYSSYDLEEECDCDFVAAPLITAGITEDYNQYSQELRLTSSPDSNIQWIGGLFFQRYKLSETDFLHVPTNASIVPFLVSQLLFSRGLCTTPMTTNPSGDCGQLAGPFNGALNPRQFSQKSTMYSAFLQGNWQMNDQWRLTAGGRLNREKKRGSRAAQLSGPNFPPPTVPQYGQVLGLFDGVLGIFPHTETGTRTETNFSPLVNLQFRPDGDTMAYLSFSQGYKSGGFDARSNRASNYTDPNPNPPPEQPGTFEFEDERATTYELGLKTALADGRAEFNAAAFMTDYKDLQTSVFDGRIGFNVGNGSAEVRGVELEGRWRPVGRLLLSGSLAALDFEWKSYTGQCYFDIQLQTFFDSGGVAPQSNCDYSGRSNQFAPDFSGVLSAQYSWPIGGLVLTANADMVYMDDYLQSPNLDPVLVQGSYTKFNARLSLADGDDRWEVALVGRNLTDKTTVAYAADAPLAFTLFKARSYYGFVEPPRAVALEARVRF